MKLIRYSLIALCVTSLLLTGCSQGIKDEVNMSGKTATTGKRSGAMLNYSLHELKEIDLTNRQADEEDSNIDIWQKLLMATNLISQLIVEFKTKLTSIILVLKPFQKPCAELHPTCT